MREGQTSYLIDEVLTVDAQTESVVSSDLSGDGVQLTGDQLQQGTLTDTIGTHHRNTGGHVQTKVDVLQKDLLRSVAEGDVLDGDDGRVQGGALHTSQTTPQHTGGKENSTTYSLGRSRSWVAASCSSVNSPMPPFLPFLPASFSRLEVAAFSAASLVLPAALARLISLTCLL